MKTAVTTLSTLKVAMIVGLYVNNAADPMAWVLLVAAAGVALVTVLRHVAD